MLFEEKENNLYFKLFHITNSISMKRLLSKGHGNPFSPFTDNVEGITVEKDEEITWCFTCDVREE